MSNHDQPLITDPVGKDTGASLNSPRPEDDWSDERWRIVKVGEVAPLRGGHGTWVETNHPAVIACMGSDPACAENGCQLQNRQPLPVSESPTTPKEQQVQIAAIRERWCVSRSVARRITMTDAQQVHRDVTVLLSALTDLQTALDASESARRSLAGELERERIFHGETIDDRDRAQEAADTLAYSIASQEEIGEHSNLNNPWVNALDVLHRQDTDHDKLLADLKLQGEQIETLTKALDGLAAAAADLVGYCDNCGGTGFIGGGNELPCAWCTPTRQALAVYPRQEHAQEP